jgi:hypothetical protein
LGSNAAQGALSHGTLVQHRALGRMAELRGGELQGESVAATSGGQFER